MKNVNSNASPSLNGPVQPTTIREAIPQPGIKIKKCVGGLGVGLGFWGC
jgi:hypothetical protein